MAGPFSVRRASCAWLAASKRLRASGSGPVAVTDRSQVVHRPIRDTAPVLELNLGECLLRRRIVSYREQRRAKIQPHSLVNGLLVRRCRTASRLLTSKPGVQLGNHDVEEPILANADEIRPAFDEHRYRRSLVAQPHMTVRPTFFSRAATRSVALAIELTPTLTITSPGTIAPADGPWVDARDDRSIDPHHVHGIDTNRRLDNGDLRVETRNCALHAGAVLKGEPDDVRPGRISGEQPELDVLTLRVGRNPRECGDALRPQLLNETIGRTPNVLARAGRERRHIRVGESAGTSLELAARRAWITAARSTWAPAPPGRPAVFTTP